MRLPERFKVLRGLVRFDLSQIPTNATTKGSSFGVRVADSLGASAFALVTIPMTPVESTTLRLNQVKIIGGQISFQMNVNGGFTNVVQFRGPFESDDWTTLTNVTVPFTTNVTVTDSTTQALRFYWFYYVNPHSR